MKKYYLIPMTDKNIYLNGESLRNILDSSHPELVQREEDRINILYSVSPMFEMPFHVKEKYNKHNIETKKMYDELQVPEYLIAYGNDKCAQEVLTKSKITTKFPAALAIRSISKEKAEEYYTISNYDLKFYNFFNNLSNISKIASPFTDFFQFEGYIEGKIGIHDIKGNFNGKIRIKKLKLKNK